MRDVARRWELAATHIIHAGTSHGLVHSVVLCILAVNLTWSAHSIGGNLGYIKSGSIAVIGRLIAPAPHLIEDARNWSSTCARYGVVSRTGEDTLPRRRHCGSPAFAPAVLTSGVAAHYAVTGHMAVGNEQCVLCGVFS